MPKIKECPRTIQNGKGKIMQQVKKDTDPKKKKETRAPAGDHSTKEKNWGTPKEEWRWHRGKHLRELRK